jgi:asparagine synthase (glutamine-hydrolysing)
MCGIVGFYSRRSEFDKAKLEFACQLIRHRGPDASNVYFDQGVGLGHQRLSIIDLSDAANQPMADATGQVVLVYNGELYNYRELRKELQALGYEFHTSSDTEVLLYMYFEYGEQCLAHLQGMFAFAIWDKRCRTLFLARDRLGIKPLYFRMANDTFSFASEIKALLALDDMPRRLDGQALHDYLTFRYTISPRTMFYGIEKLPPAHSLMLSEGDLRIERYWSPDYRKTESMVDEEWIEALGRQFTDTVTSHLVSDVPVGVLLSGGLDSSVVAAVMQARLTKPIKTFSVAFAEGGIYDERPYARKVAQHLGTDHHEICINAQDFLEALPAFIWHMDEPVADPAAIPLYYVSQLARRHVTVVLSGEGSDELLAGYAFWVQFKGYRRLKLFKRLPVLVRETFIRGLNSSLFRSDKLEKYLQMSRQPISSYGRMVPNYQDNVFNEDEKRRLYRLDFLQATPALEDSVDQVRAAYRRAVDFEFLDQMLYVSMMQWLPEDLLVKADKMTMAHSLELRVPFLDHALVDFIARMPTHLKVRRKGTTYTVKYALKKAFAALLPREIVEREKLGFAVPYAKWFKHEMRDMLHDVLLSQAARENGILNPAEVERLLKVALSPVQKQGDDIWDPDAKKIWSLFVFELWRQRFNVVCA